MAKKPAPQARMVRLRNVETGAVIERFPVDARGMLLSKEYVAAEAPLTEEELHRKAAKAATAAAEAEVQASAPAEVPAPAGTIAEQLDRWELKDLQKLAERVQLDPTDKSRAQLVDALATDLPELVSAGLVSLEQLPELKITPEQFPNATPAE